MNLVYIRIISHTWHNLAHNIRVHPHAHVYVQLKGIFVVVNQFGFNLDFNIKTEIGFMLLSYKQMAKFEAV